MSDFFRRDSDTKLRWQADKETSGDNLSVQPKWKIGELLGDFVLEQLLGHGSSGFVYRVFDTKTRRRGALKLLRLGNPDVLVLNRLGFRRMMQVEHPNLLRVDRIYKLGEYTALAMEEVKGVTFDKAVTQLKRLPRDRAFARLLELMRDFAAGLAAMHASGLIHRDIKPANLMVGDDGRGRVIDYGLVDGFGVSEPKMVPTTRILGTPHYLAPEIIFRQHYLPAGDIFALGIVMLEATQILTFASADGEEFAPNIPRDLASQIDAELLRDALNGLSNEVPEMITETCREMLDRDPSERPTATQVARLGLELKAPQPLSMGDSLIGRESQYAEIIAWIDSVFDGSVSRLHLTGPSGIGKTRLLEEVIAYIESKNWGQVFRGRCRLREDSALQAFEQICDAIASRYMNCDREAIELEPDHGLATSDPKRLDLGGAKVLCGIFPVLRSIFSDPIELPPAAAAASRLESLDASVRLSMHLRDVGPLFIVIDDSQWADRDSLNVLDRLQTGGGEVGLGIITVSRESSDPQQAIADRSIALGPIATDDLKCYLAKAAGRWGITISDPALTDLAEATGGSPFRLRELANEFRPDGALSQLDFESNPDCSVTELVDIDHLWNHRLQRLSDDAKSVLLFVVTAGGRVSTEQLGLLTGQGEEVDTSVSELSQLRLITDEATGGECISIFHDRFAAHVINSLNENDKREANKAWASLLVRQDNPESLAARIAGHWFAAGQPGRAISHAILAAEDAERRTASTEAARWHTRVIEHVSGEEKTHHIRQAARYYHEADIPIEAARYYQMLGELVEPDEHFDCQLLATVMLLRSGQYALVRENLGLLAGTLGLPRPKPSLLSKISILFNVFRLAMYRRTLMQMLGAESTLPETTMARLPRMAACPDPSVEDELAHRLSLNSGTNRVNSLTSESRNDRRQQQRFDLCVSLVRPMTMFDTLYATELNVSAARWAHRFGTTEQRIHVAVGEAVFGSYDRGSKRLASLTNLLALVPIAQRSGSDQAKGDVWAGIAFAHALSCRWEQVDQPLESSIDCYRRIDGSHGFEIAHVGWLGLWGNWYRGRWKAMTQLSDRMIDEASRRNDLFQKQITCGAIGGNAWLVRDRLDDLDRQRAKHKTLVQLGPNEMLTCFDYVGRIYRSIYAGLNDDAWQEYQRLNQQIRRSPFSGIQMFRVLGQSLGGLIALHCNADEPSDIWKRRIRRLTLSLRSENLRQSRILANYYDALLSRQIADSTSRPQESQIYREMAIGLFEKSQAEAKEASLRPIQFAAADELARLTTGQCAGLLRQRMIAGDVVDPDKLARLYTVLPRK